MILVFVVVPEPGTVFESSFFRTVGVVDETSISVILRFKPCSLQKTESPVGFAMTLFLKACQCRQDRKSAS